MASRRGPQRAPKRRGEPHACDQPGHQQEQHGEAEWPDDPFGPGPVRGEKLADLFEDAGGGEGEHEVVVVADLHGEVATEGRHFVGGQALAEAIGELAVPLGSFDAVVAGPEGDPI